MTKFTVLLHRGLQYFIQWQKMGQIYRGETLPLILIKKIPVPRNNVWSKDPGLSRQEGRQHGPRPLYQLTASVLCRGGASVAKTGD